MTQQELGDFLGYSQPQIRISELERGERNPSGAVQRLLDMLVAFSWYLSGRKNVLLDVAEEIRTNLKEGFSSSPIDMGFIDRAKSLM